MRRPNSFSMLVFFILFGVGAALSLAVATVAEPVGIGLGVLSLVFAMTLSSAIKVADQWERAM